MPAAQFHYPFENSRRSSTSAFPADFICEAIDQTRGWFYSLLAVNTLVFDSTPYRNVVCLGLLVDEDGQKMSKSKGNVIDPWTMLDTTAPTRCAGTSSPPASRGRRAGCPTRASTSRPARRCSRSGTSSRSSSPTRTSTAGRPTRRADAEPDARARPVDPRELDDTVAAVTDALEASTRSRGAQALAAFVDDLSNWYVRRSRPRFWKARDPARPRHAARVPRHDAPAARAVLPVPRRRALHRAHRRALGAHCRLAGGRRPRRRRLEAEMAGGAPARRPSAAPARTDAKVKVRQPLRRALLLHPGTDAVRRRRRPRSPTSST